MTSRRMRRYSPNMVEQLLLKKLDECRQQEEALRMRRKVLEEIVNEMKGLREDNNKADEPEEPEESNAETQHPSGVAHSRAERGLAEWAKSMDRFGKTEGIAGKSS